MSECEGHGSDIKITIKEAQALKDRKDAGIWGDVFNRSHRQLVRIASRVVNFQDAEDVVMGGWERFTRKTFTSDQPVTEDVLVGAVVSEAWSFRRKAQGRYTPKPSLESMPEIEMQSTQPDVETQALGSVILDDVMRRIHEMGKSKQLAAVLSGLGYTAPEIAAMTGLTRNTVDQGVSKARRAVKESFPDLFSS